MKCVGFVGRVVFQEKLSQSFIIWHSMKIHMQLSNMSKTYQMSFYFLCHTPGNTYTAFLIMEETMTLHMLSGCTTVLVISKPIE